MARVAHSEKVPASMQNTYNKIVELTDAFCAKHLNEEYAQMIRYATAALCRKRPSPLVNGKPGTWACGITYAIGFVNFLSDRSTSPSMSVGELCEAFGVSKSTGGAKSKVVRDILGMSHFDPRYCLPSQLDNNPMAWLITVNGFPMDARHAPLMIQKMAFEKGMIPYIPGENPDD